MGKIPVLVTCGNFRWFDALWGSSHAKVCFNQIQAVDHHVVCQQGSQLAIWGADQIQANRTFDFRIGKGCNRTNLKYIACDSFFSDFYAPADGCPVRPLSALSHDGCSSHSFQQLQQARNQQTFLTRSAIRRILSGLGIGPSPPTSRG